MTEAEWQACTEDPVTMLVEVCLLENLRKLNLFACTCLRVVQKEMSASALAIFAELERTLDSAQDTSAWGNQLIELEIDLAQKVWVFDTGQFTQNWSPEI